MGGVGSSMLYYFNPDTEMALAHGRGVFTPPKQVQAFMDNLALLPALYAPGGSGVLVPDRLKGKLNALPYRDIAKGRCMELVLFSELDRDAVVCPWGWNHSLRACLARQGLRPDMLPDAGCLDRWRELAHRATTISVFEHINDPLLNARKPMFFADPAKAVGHIRMLAGRGVKPVVKLPWSSSGRGVFIAPQGYALTKILNSRQGVTIEPMWDKTLDFATEWECREGKALFMGYSVFVNANGGRYAGNIVAGQEYLRDMVARHSKPGLPDLRIAALQTALDSIVAPYYDGALGVDMLCDNEGEINPCVEINLRMTMGHVALRLGELFPAAKPYIFMPGRPLKAGSI